MSDNRDWQADMKDIQTWIENRHWVDMPHPEQTLNGEPLANIILHWLQQYAAEKERADKLRQYLTRMIDTDDIFFHEPIRWKDSGSKLLASLFPKEATE